MTRVALAAFAAALALACAAAPARAADECAGLMVCIPVAGPWVIVAPSSAASSSSLWRLTCPTGVVGGTDARVSERRVGVSFPGRVGSPVGPGVTVADDIVFAGRYVGAARGHVTSFRPYIGCVPASGGGRRTPTSAPVAPSGPVAQAAAAGPVRPAETVAIRTRTLRLPAGRLARGSVRCRTGERLLRASHAIGLRMAAVPTAVQAQAIRVVRVVRGGRVLVSATRGEQLGDVVAQVQIQAECRAR